MDYSTHVCECLCVWGGGRDELSVWFGGLAGALMTVCRVDAKLPECGNCEHATNIITLVIECVPTNCTARSSLPSPPQKADTGYQVACQPKS
jgi:hypothetical protein